MPDLTIDLSTTTTTTTTSKPTTTTTYASTTTDSSLFNATAAAEEEIGKTEKPSQNASLAQNETAQELQDGSKDGTLPKDLTGLVCVATGWGDTSYSKNEKIQ